MIKLTEGGLTAIWPDKESPEIIALSYALQQGIKMAADFADKTRCYSGIDNLESDTLDALAVEMRSMYYDQQATVDVKRNIVKGTLNWYTHAGTPSAVAELVAAVFGGGDVVEWFDYTEPPYTPMTFDVLSEGSIKDQQTFEDMIRKVKNVRSHLRRVVYLREAHQNARQVMFGVAVQESICANYVREDTASDSAAHAVIHSDAAETVTVINAKTESIEAHESKTTIGQIAEPLDSTTTVM